MTFYFLDKLNYFFWVNFPVLGVDFPLSANELFKSDVSAVELTHQSELFESDLDITK